MRIFLYNSEIRTFKALLDQYLHHWVLQFPNQMSIQFFLFQFCFGYIKHIVQTIQIHAVIKIRWMMDPLGQNSED